jgi:phosphatidylserine decarboxylase
VWCLGGSMLEFSLSKRRRVAKMRGMKHAGKAFQAGLKVVFWALIALAVITIMGLIAALVGTFVAAFAGFLFGLWVLFALACLWFFRDPNPRVPLGADQIVAPAHGKIDVIEETTELEFLAGPCRRISIFLSIFDVHVQNAPVAGRVAHLEHHPGEFMNAMRPESSLRNEHVLLGIESSEKAGERIALRLNAGVIARRIVPWAKVGDIVARGERLSLIQFGSRVDLFLPLEYRLLVQVGDRVRSGETVVAERI